MTINSMRADWLWSLMLVTVQVKHYGAAHALNKIRIEPRGGSPMLIATDGCMMSVIHHTEADCKGFDTPFTLLLDGDLRKSLQRLGKNGRPRATVSIDLDKDGDPRFTVRKDDSIVQIIDGPAAKPLVLHLDRFPAWTRVLPAPEQLEGSWRRLAAMGAESVKGFNPEFLRKIPVFDDGAIFFQPVLPKVDVAEGYHAVRTYIVREHGMEKRAFTLMMPMELAVGFDPALEAPLPACVREAEDKAKREADARAEQERLAEQDANG